MIPRSFGTHDGSFHADEVTACALLLVFGLIDKDKIIRTRDMEKLASCEYVCDVGGIYDPHKKRFDHHQSEYRGDLSSAGMVWLYLKEREIVDGKVYDFFNRSLIWGVDAHDNGRVKLEVGVCTFSQVLANFVPPQYDAEENVQRKAFDEALIFVEGHLRRLLDRYLYTQECREKVAACMEANQKYLLFDKAMPWMDSFFELGGEKHPALFVAMPSNGHWKLRGIPPTLEDRMQVRMPLPEKWAGLLEEDLRRASGIAGAVFCHKGRFVSVWKTKEDALRALELVLGDRFKK